MPLIEGIFYIVLCPVFPTYPVSHNVRVGIFVRTLPLPDPYILELLQGENIWQEVQDRLGRSSSVCTLLDKLICALNVLLYRMTE